MYVHKHEFVQYFKIQLITEYSYIQKVKKFADSELQSQKTYGKVHKF